jgi:signal transduction histidine kinase
MVSRITRWERDWNPPPLLLDSALALGLTVAVQAEAGWLVAYPGLAAAALLMTLPLVWRRHRPLSVFAVVTVGFISTFFINTRSTDSALVYTSIIVVLIAAYSVGAYSRHRRAAAGALAATATLVAVAFTGSGMPPLPEAVVPYVVLLVPFLVGQAFRTRELRADAFRERAMRLEQEHEFAAQIARGEERARIARELHDVVAHTVSVMVVQAGAAQHIVETQPGQAIQALAAVEATGREAMAELRSLLGVLTPSDGEAPLAPQPGMAQVPALVQRVRDSGLPVELHVTGTPRPLAPGLDLTVYRIVQESLTNTLKHAGPVRTEIGIDYRHDALKVEVLDEGTGQSPGIDATGGRGLAGMRDRVALYGGALEAGPRLGRGYAVRAWLPLPRAEP